MSFAFRYALQVRFVPGRNLADSVSVRLEDCDLRLNILDRDVTAYRDPFFEILNALEPRPISVDSRRPTA
jgi:hypothetical protein